MSIFHSLLAWAAGIIVAVISSTGYLGVILLMAIESACIPLPSEVIMPFAGYLASTGELNLWLVATAGAIGCNVGSVVAYEAGKRGGRPFVARWGKYVLVSLHDLDRAEAFVARWGSIAMLVCRMLPVVRSFIAFPAGVARMNLWKFHLYTFIGSWPWCYALAWVGFRLGRAWDQDPRLKALLHRLDFVVVGVILALGIWFLWHKYAEVRREKARRQALGVED
ncbi:DedA family protein [Sphingomonas jatrophae]|uniref:Membrane protein DedA, SNARE-associated domain n=1 Tax=Sphingomonas jatrophae TaxID=1166337 RepID=A0A1I6M9E6_9SPHN|nr:DedA family protein [Sphingomonas jatrophae]SFS12248.1 membrane protein DedA, SNARE-associated domain [Sphingomonas jatrophae]